MFDGKLFVKFDQDYYDSSDGSSPEISCILLGPKDATLAELKKEWVDTSWKGRSYTRKGVVRTGKQKYQTISFYDWLLKVKEFTLVKWEVI